MKTTNSKVRLSFGIIFSLIYLSSLIAFITLAIIIQPISFNDFMATETSEIPTLYFLVILSVPITIITSIISITLFNGCDKNLACKILYVLSYIPVGILGIGVLIVIGIIMLINKMGDVQARVSPSSSYTKTVNVKDKLGYDSKLEWDNNTETWRDSMGKHYTSNDNGKTFKQK